MKERSLLVGLVRIIRLRCLDVTRGFYRHRLIPVGQFLASFVLDHDNSHDHINKKQGDSNHPGNPIAN